jgi:DNA-binding transcriptional MerR regulator
MAMNTARGAGTADAPDRGALDATMEGDEPVRGTGPASSGGSSSAGQPADEAGSAVDWSVGRVSDRLGIPTPTLRSWDRRYGVGPSQRTHGGHRRYSEDDIRRVRVMALFIDRGVPAQSAARVATAMDSDRLRIETEADQGTRDDGVRGRVAAICRAAVALDHASLAALYQQVLREHDLVTAWTEVLSPALQRIGDQWGTGALGVESEHLASELLVTELRAIIHATRPTRPRHDVVLASADDEQHYLPLLALQAELSRRGLSVSYLGPRMPTQALSEVLRTRRPDRVFLWASLGRASNEPIWQTLNIVDHPLLVVIGGPGWPTALPPVSPRVRVRRAHDLGGAADLLTHPKQAWG